MSSPHSDPTHCLFHRGNRFHAIPDQSGKNLKQAVPIRHQLGAVFNPVRDRDGALLFRPGGHGALIYNLARLDGDIVFLKNIDNVQPDRVKPT
ncbi:MAG: DUF4301 family protein, partial [Deltaproteobacteria bacterium]|nr:DUF4301 family protein [Deltaproteobacteria bacterium]